MGDEREKRRHRLDMFASTQVSKMLLEARRRTRLEDYPDLAGLRAGRRIKYLSQEEVAALADVSIHWYAMLERGDLSRVFSDDYLHRIATVLNLTGDERLTLFLLVEHRSLGSRVRGGMEANDRGRERLGESPTAAVIAGQPWPAVVTDSMWEILAANGHFRRWFPGWRRHGNLMRMMLTDEGTRAQLVDWESVHAPALVAQLRAALTKRPDDSVLKEFVLELLETSRVLERLWQTQTRCEFVEEGKRYDILVPGSTVPTTVAVSAMRPVGSPGLVVRAYVPVDGFRPDLVITRTPAA